MILDKNFQKTPNLLLQFDNFLVKSVYEITLLNTCVILAWAVKAEKKSRFSPTQVGYFKFVVKCTSRSVGSALSGLAKADKLYATSQFRSAGNQPIRIRFQKSQREIQNLNRIFN